MSQENAEKKEGCCGTTGHTSGSCCSGKKLIIGLLTGALLFAAGVLFAKTQYSSGKTCSMGQMK